MIILGISAFYHDSAIALIKEGRVIFAAEEERFTRKKHDDAFPTQALAACWRQTGINPEEIDLIAYYEKPLLKFERILETFVKTYPYSIKPFVKAIPDWVTTKIKVEHTIRKTLGYKKKIYFVPHHLSHAASAFYLSPFRDAAILTVDGIGEYQTTSMWCGQQNTISHLSSLLFPNSLGLLYSTFTAFLGFQVNEDEYKVMGLGAYGKPKYVKQIHKMIDQKKDGSFLLDMKFFRFRENFQMWSSDFEALFGLPRTQESNIQQRHKDIAASIQVVSEEILFSILSHLHSLTKLDAVCIGGGVALNALANGKILQRTPFKKVYIFGPAGDNGSAIGCALQMYNFLEKKKKNRFFLENLNFGTEYSDKEILLTMKKHTIQYKRYSEVELPKKVAELLAKDKVIGVFQGKMEFGPRALGYRSILANPKPSFMKEKVNMIKGREAFRPFGGVFLKENLNEYVESSTQESSFPFMNFCFQVKQDKKRYIAAITHADGSCRIQTVDKTQPFLYRLITHFYEITGTAALLNTSFNLKGEPIVETPSQAIDDFLKTPMEYLVIGNFILSKD